MTPKSSVKRRHSDPEFTVVVEDRRAGRCKVEAYASDPVGALATEAAEKLGVRFGHNDTLTLATLDGRAFAHNDRIGYPADRTFRLVVTGGTP